MNSLFNTLLMIKAKVSVILKCYRSMVSQYLQNRILYWHTYIVGYYREGLANSFTYHICTSSAVQENGKSKQFQ